jgi:hypothetical protein
MPRDYDPLASHGGGKVGGSAIVAEKQVATLQYGADLSEAGTGDNDRRTL